MASASTVDKPSLDAFMADGGGGAIDVRGVFAPEAYFRLAKRDPATLGMDPSREIIFYVMVETHEHEEDLPRPDVWWNAASLSIAGEGDYHPSKQRLVFDSGHHQTVALAFQPSDGLELSRYRGSLTLAVPSIEGDGARDMRWQLPLSTGKPASPLPGFVPAFLAALLPLLAGLLVTFSPCVVHMTTYYVPIFGSVVGGKPGAGTRRKMALVSGLFTLGFAIPYTVAGVVVGYAGHFVKSSSFLEGLSQPLTWVAGGIVLYLGLQLAGVLRLPMLHRLRLLPFQTGRGQTGYLASGLLGLNLATGCLGCVGGSLFASLLLYGGAIGSPLEAGVLLFLFAVAANVPFFLVAVTLGRFQLRGHIPPGVRRYVGAMSGAMLIAMGLLILSGTESLMEDGLIRVLGIPV